MRLFSIGFGRPVPLRHHLLLLVVGVLLPMVAFSAAVVWRLSMENRAIAERRLIRSAYDLAVSIDRELAGTIRALNALAQSERLEEGDFKGFEEEALRILRVQPAWWSVIVLDTSGQMLLNTAHPNDTNLPRVVDEDSFRQVLELRRPVIGYLKSGQREQVLAFPVRVPVIYEDSVRYVLTITMKAPAVSSFLSLRQEGNDEWSRVIADAKGTIVAGTREPDRFVGQPLSARFVENAKATEGVFAHTAPQGNAVYVGYNRAPLSGWIAAVVVPAEVLDGPPQRSMLGLAAAGLGSLLLSAVGAFVLSRRVGRGVRDAGKAAETLAQGGSPVTSTNTIAEVAQLHDAIARAGALLAEREQQRQEHLANADKARKEAEAASGAKDQFLAVLSHELRTPLTPVLAAVQMIEQDGTLTGEAKDSLVMIRRNVQLEVKLIDDLLDLTRVARGKLDLQWSAVDVHEKLRHVAQICEPDILAKQQHLKVEFHAPRAVVRADPARLQQVLWNLLKNAVKFTPENGSLLVQTRHADGLLQVEFTDTGIGIEPAALARIFDAFEQGSQSVTRQFGGLGLGLSISKAIVDLHGGTLMARSEGTNKGSTFILRMPLAVAPTKQVAKLPSSDPAVQPATRGGKILLVEDNPDTAKAMAMLLRRFGYEVKAADGVTSALKAAESQRFDLVVSDLGLTDGTGYELMRQLRTLYQMKGVALSGYGMDDDIRQSIEAGFSDHLTKPVEMSRLEKTLRELIQRGNGSDT